jgi:carboxymethylenebutenolidase
MGKARHITNLRGRWRWRNSCWPALPTWCNIQSRKIHLAEGEGLTIRTTTLFMLAAVVAALGASIAAGAVTGGDVPDAILGRGEPPRGESVRYFDADADSLGYLAVPAGEGPFGGVILIHEWNGLVDRIRQVADALADEGYVALAADLFSGRTGSTREENMELVQTSLADPDRIIANLDAATAFLKDRTDITGKVATIGWCYGGGVALSFAMGSANHDGTAIFYGRLVDDPARLRHIQHEIHGTFAGQDQSPSPEQVERFVSALRAAGVPNDVHVYDEVNHGFWLYVERDPDANLEPASHAWQRLKDYLERTLH